METLWRLSSQLENLTRATQPLDAGRLSFAIQTRKREFDIVMSGQFCTLAMFSSGLAFLLHVFDFPIPLYHL